jgi:hypothetical protein
MRISPMQLKLKGWRRISILEDGESRKILLCEDRKAVFWPQIRSMGQRTGTHAGNG